MVPGGAFGANADCGFSQGFPEFIGLSAFSWPVGACVRWSGCGILRLQKGQASVAGDPTPEKKEAVTESGCSMGVPCATRGVFATQGLRAAGARRVHSEEIALLARFGHWMHALASGAIAPVTAERRHFLAVVQHEAVAETPFESVWTKLRQRNHPIGGGTVRGTPGSEPPSEPAAGSGSLGNPSCGRSSRS